MSLEQALADHTAALKANTAILERVVAGQEAAMAKLEGAAAKPARASRKAADPEPEAKAEPKAAEPAAAAKDTPPAVTQEMLKTEALALRNGTEDEALRANYGQFLVAMTAHFGAKALTGPDGLNDPDQLKQAIFFVKRKAAGAEVDFSADYDFDGDPAQGAAEYDPLG